MTSVAEQRLMADLARVPVVALKVQQVGRASVVTLHCKGERIGAYGTMPAAVDAACVWARANGHTEPVIELPCGTQIAASDYDAWREQQETPEPFCEFTGPMGGGACG